MQQSPDRPRRAPGSEPAMSRHRWRSAASAAALLLVLALGLGAVLPPASSPAGDGPRGGPDAVCAPAPASADLPALPSGAARLAVLVVFDQLRGDYLTRWDGLFGEGGFHRLEQEGAWFQNCHYPYAHTVTAAGHASMLTGCSPATHGIVANEWRDRASGEEVYCVG